MLADALLRSVAGTTALLRVTGTNADTNHVGSGAWWRRRSLRLW